MNEAADGSCCDAGLGLVWRCYWIYMSFVCLIQKKNICFGFLKGRGCVESKNKTSAKRKSTMSSLDPSIIQVDSFKCRADVPLISTNYRLAPRNGPTAGSIASCHSFSKSTWLSEKLQLVNSWLGFEFIHHSRISWFISDL